MSDFDINKKPTCSCGKEPIVADAGMMRPILYWFCRSCQKEVDPNKINFVNVSIKLAPIPFGFNVEVNQDEDDFVD